MPSPHLQELRGLAAGGEAGPGHLAQVGLEGERDPEGAVPRRGPHHLHGAARDAGVARQGAGRRGRVREAAAGVYRHVGHARGLAGRELQLAELTPGAAIARLIQDYTRYIVNTGESGFPTFT